MQDGTGWDAAWQTDAVNGNPGWSKSSSKCTGMERQPHARYTPFDELQGRVIPNVSLEWDRGRCE